MRGLAGNSIKLFVVAIALGGAVAPAAASGKTFLGGLPKIRTYRLDRAGERPGKGRSEPLRRCGRSA